MSMNDKDAERGGAELVAALRKIAAIGYGAEMSDSAEERAEYWSKQTIRLRGIARRALAGEVAAPLAWRPMDSAPLDGSAALLWKGGEAYTARWIQSETMGPVWATPDGHVIFRASHWMPLPAPPREA